MRTLLGLLTVAWLALPLPATAQSNQAAPASSGASMLSPGDSVRIVVWRKPEFTGDYVVAPDGSITHPLFRTVKVAGVPFATAEANLRRFLSGFEENPQFVMEPLVRVAVSGQVAQPRLYALRPETTISEAVARAGGAREEGAPNRTKVLRIDESGRQTQFLVDLTNPEAGAGSYPVRSGDQIIIPERRSFFRNVLLPALGVIGSVASIGLLIDRYSRDN
jgi:polysaccharide biosynthesis/export protein